MTNVFISYRREDTTAGFAALIHDRLASSRTCDVFMDIDNLPFGVDFEEHIRMALRACDVALVLIGALWLDVHDADGTRRLDNPADVHRLEIAEVLRRGTVPVIPVLFGSVKMPRTEELPEEIRALTRRHAFYWHLEQTSASQLQGIRDAVRRIRRSMPEEETTNLGAAPVDVEGDLPVTEEVGIGRALSARVIGLCAELLSDLGDTATAAAIQDIQGPLLSSGHGTKVLSDAGQADRALQRLDALSWTDPGLSFIRDRVEELRDSGPEMQMIELAKWYERSSVGDLQLPEDKWAELRSLLGARTASKQLGLGPEASRSELRAAAERRALAWRRFEVAALASPMARRAASEVVGFYEQMAMSDG